MSLIPLVAALIQRAATDEMYALDLDYGVNTDEGAFDGLVRADMDAADIGWLTPSEWLWFGRWREGMGGPLDRVLLDYLEFAATSRYARFQLRGLAMRDPVTAARATTASATDQRHDDVGLSWLQRHAQRTIDSRELTHDALQYATEPAWFTLRVLTGLDDDRGRLARDTLREFAEERDLSTELTSRWTTT